MNKCQFIHEKGCAEKVVTFRALASVPPIGGKIVPVLVAICDSCRNWAYGVAPLEFDEVRPAQTEGMN